MNKKEKNRKRILSLFLALAMVVSLMAGAKPVNAYAADYSYNSSKNYSEYTADGLNVYFTLTDVDGLNMHYWTIYLFNPSRFSYVSYDQSTHKLTNSGI